MYFGMCGRRDVALRAFSCRAWASTSDQIRLAEHFSLRAHVGSHKHRILYAEGASAGMPTGARARDARARARSNSRAHAHPYEPKRSGLLCEVSRPDNGRPEISERQGKLM